MFFDRESTVVITKLNNLPESALTAYCQKFGTVVRCFIKNTTQTRIKEPYALIKFSDKSSVTSILSHRIHTINGINVLIREYHQDTTNSASTQSIPSLMSLTQQNQNTPNKNNNGQNGINYDQIMQENHALKFEVANLQKSLNEAQNYSKTAYETFQILREKFEAEQALTTKLKSEHAATIESYETKLKQLPSSSSLTPMNIKEQDKVKDEPIDCNLQQTISANHLLEMQILKEHLEQAQIDLGKCQTENSILNAKLISREKQFEIRYSDLNSQYIRVKKQYDHISSCIKDFHSKLYHKKRLKDEYINKSNDENKETSNDSNDDVIEIIMQVDPMVP